jgi:hypothetical protein
MSLAADPNQTFEYVLVSDRQMPVEKRPVFFIKYLTTRQWRHLMEFREKIKTLTTSQEITELAIEIVKPNIMGWRNIFDSQGQPIKFSADKIEDVLSNEDFYELMGAERSQQSLSVEDKKKLDSQSQCNTDSSAENAKE